MIAVAGAVAATSPACGGDSGLPGMCSAQVPAGHACNAIVNVASPIMPTCTTDTMPTGTGGVIADGTYVLTSQTYYDLSNCSDSPIAETVIMAGDCFQAVFGLFESGSTAAALTGTGSALVTVQDSAITLTPTCSSTGFTTSMQDAPTSKTYTATPTTLTIYTHNTGTSSTNPDRVEVMSLR